MGSPAVVYVLYRAPLPGRTTPSYAIIGVFINKNDADEASRVFIINSLDPVNTYGLFVLTKELQ